MIDDLARTKNSIAHSNQLDLETDMPIRPVTAAVHLTRETIAIVISQ